MTNNNGSPSATTTPEPTTEGNTGSAEVIAQAEAIIGQSVEPLYNQTANSTIDIQIIGVPGTYRGTNPDMIAPDIGLRPFSPFINLPPLCSST